MLLYGPFTLPWQIAYRFTAIGALVLLMQNSGNVVVVTFNIRQPYDFDFLTCLFACIVKERYLRYDRMVAVRKLHKKSFQIG